MTPVPHQLRRRAKPWRDQRRQLKQPLQQGPHQAWPTPAPRHLSKRHGWVQSDIEAPSCHQSRPTPTIKSQARHQRRDGRNPKFIRRVQGPETEADQARPASAIGAITCNCDDVQSHAVQEHSPGPTSVIRWICRQHQNRRSPASKRALTRGVERREDVGSLRRGGDGSTR